MNIKIIKPLVSIFMPVYNAGEFFAETIASIQNQTYENWELIAVDDWSKDNSYAMLKAFEQKDNRIKVYRNGRHHGVAGAGNLAVKRAKGSYIARMDADDVMVSNRLLKQVRFLQTNPDVIVVGTQCRLIDRNGKHTGDKLFPLGHNEIKQMMFVTIPVQQPTMMVNRKLLSKDFVWYREDQHTAEEVDLLFRLFKYGRFANLPQKLLKYRIHGNNTSLLNPKKTFFTTLKTRIRAVREYGYKPTLFAVAVTFSQAILVGLLPSKWIFPLYSVLRESLFVKEIKKVLWSANFKSSNSSALEFFHKKITYAYKFVRGGIV